VGVRPFPAREVTVKAAVCYAFGAPSEVEEVEIDAPQAGEVKVRLAAAGICHSDIHMIRGDWAGTLPLVASTDPQTTRTQAKIV
jgi:Zn-dependent alcohol dehydrogenase